MPQSPKIIQLCLSNLSFSSASLFSFFSFCSMLSFNYLFFLSKISFLFQKYEAFCLLLDFLANSRALSSSCGVNLFLHSFVLFLMYRMLPSYARSSAFGFSFISRSSMPKSLSDSTLVVATLFVWDQMSQSRFCLFVVVFFHNQGY